LLLKKKQEKDENIINAINKAKQMKGMKKIQLSENHMDRIIRWLKVMHQMGEERKQW